jgi:GT2 family glycosyltransferase
MTVPVTIIIPSYKDWQKLELCLNSLHRQTYPQEHYEIIVVNNEPDKTVPFEAEKYPKVTLIHEPKPGSYAARNAGLRIAKGSIIGFTDADCIPKADWIQAGVNYLQSHPECTRIAGRFEIIYKSKKPSFIEVYNDLYSFPQQAVINNYGGSMTGNLFTYKSVFDSVGLFNDQFFSYGDLEWGKRAQKAGFRVDYVDDVVVFHPARSFKELLVKEKRLGGGVANFNYYERPRWFHILVFFHSLRPSSRALKSISSNNRYDRIKYIIVIPILRYLFGTVRSYEIMRVRLGKMPNRL